MTQDEEIALLRRQVADLTDRVNRLEKGAQPFTPPISTPFIQPQSPTSVPQWQPPPQWHWQPPMPVTYASVVQDSSNFQSWNGSSERQ